jgi:hypothetical protein
MLKKTLSALAILAIVATNALAANLNLSSFPVTTGADRLCGWDDSASKSACFSLGTGLSTAGTTLNASFAGFTTSDLPEGSNLYFTDERAQDSVGSILLDSTTIDFTYDDTNITAIVKANSIDATQLTNTINISEFVNDSGYISSTSGNWTGTFDGQEGTYYLSRANHTGTQLLATISDVTASASEVNILDGATLSTTELNYVDGVTSAIQTQLDGKQATLTTGNLTATSPVSVSATRQVIGGAAAISIADAAADGTTKGASTYTAADFNAATGLISIDYTNGQAASGSNKGFLTSTDWTTFNNKVGTGANSSLTSFSGLTGGIASPTFITFAGTASPSYTQGRLVYDTDNESLTFYNNESNVSLQIGQEAWIRVRNDTGSTIANGAAVYISGVHASGIPQVSLAQANSASTTVGMGLATQSIPTNSIGYVTSLGLVRNIDTSGFASGAIVYISPTTPGALTTTAPTAPNYRYRVGVVTRSNATTGTIHVTPTTAALGNGTANQLFGINTAGTAQEVKSLVTGTAGTDFAIANTANTMTFNLPTASASNTGKLSSTDWSTFNGKQAGDATLTALAAYNTNGILTQTAADTFTGRTITGTASRVSVANGNGVSGNPTIDIDSNYVGQTSITTLGTIGTGTWNGSTIAVANGGTGANTLTGILKGNGTSAFTAVTAPSGAIVGTTDSQALSNKDLTAGTNTFPTFNQNTTGSAASLTTARSIYGNNFNGTADLSQVIASTFGGTGNGFTKFSGPTTSEKTFTLPNASAAILTDNAAVSVAQGGTGRATGTTAYSLIATGTTATGAQQTLANGATTEILVGGGAAALPVWTTATGSGAPVRATSPTLVTPTLGAATATSINTGSGAVSNIIAGTYTPTLFNGSNVDSSSVTVPWQYLRVGNVVTVSGSITIDATAAAATSTNVDATLPIASNLANVGECAGNLNSTGSVGGAIRADTTNDRSELFYNSQSTSAVTFYVIFTYQII